MSKLPKEFADLEPFSDWCIAAEADRYRKRLDSSMPEIQALYDAVTPRAEAALRHLDQYSLDALPDDALKIVARGADKEGQAAV